MPPRLPLLAALIGSLLAGGAVAKGSTPEVAALALARQQADAATLRAQALERKAEAASNEASRAYAAAAALVARIQAAEAGITAAEARVRIIEARRMDQRERLAERQQPLLRLTAALQTMSRRPPALALVQPGSVRDIVHVRALLAATLPEVRRNTAALRAEIAAADRLREQSDVAVATLVSSQAKLRRQRAALTEIEARQRRRSQQLAETALGESDRALAFGEQARDLAEQAGSLRYRNLLRTRLAELPGPSPRPTMAGEPPLPRLPAYRLPVEGRLVRGTGEISDAGVHARGLTFATASGTPVSAPAGGRIAYSAPFRGYGQIVIIDHGGGWTSTLTDLAGSTVRTGDMVRPGTPIGQAGEQLSIELRRDNRPFPIATLLR